MLFHVTEEKKFEVIRSQQVVCKNCKAQCPVHLLKEIRKVTAFFVFSSTHFSYHIACSSCMAIYFVNEKLVNQMGNSTLDKILERTGNREYPFMLRLMFLIWAVFVFMPLVGLIMAWQTNDYRVYFGDNSSKYHKFMIWISIFINLGWGYFIYSSVSAKNAH